jgi:hypothetical protein
MEYINGTDFEHIGTKIKDVLEHEQGNRRLRELGGSSSCIFVSDFNEITPSKLLGNNIKVKEKFLLCWFTLITTILLFTHCSTGIIALDIFTNNWDRFSVYSPEHTNM